MGGSGKHVGAVQLEDWAGAEPHRKHVLHARNAGGVEAQRLVERIRVLPRVQREGIDEGAAGGPGDGRAWGRWPK